MNRRIFKLVPIAESWDQNWDHAENQGVIVVRADSPADARVLASEVETDFVDIDAKPEHGVSTRFASAFRDEKLYSVFEIDSDYPSDGPRQVLEGHMHNPLKPAQVRE